MSNWANIEATGGNDDDNDSSQNESQIVEWLKDNNLEQIIPKFKEENMTMDELVSLGQDIDDLKEYLKSLNIAKPSILRICSKIKNRLNQKNKDNEDNDIDLDINKNIPPKVVRIVLTQNEEN